MQPRYEKVKQSLDKSRNGQLAVKPRKWHAFGFVLASAIAIAVVVYLAKGYGTKVDVAYDMGPDGGDVGGSVTTAEALVPVYTAVLAVMHLVLACKHGLSAQLFGRTVLECVVYPLMTAQMAMMARVADTEKITLLVFATFGCGVCDLAADAFAYVSANVLDGKRMSDDPLPVRLQTGANALRCAGIAFWLAAWTVMATNAGWHLDHTSGLPSYTAGLFAAVFAVSALERVRVLSDAWCGDRRCCNLFSVGPFIAPFILTALLAFVSL
jgi:hypothetical protein